jgi:hypothetical protein
MAGHRQSERDQLAANAVEENCISGVKNKIRQMISYRVHSPN